MKRDKGYSLVELVLTLAIFSVVMLSIIMMMRTATVSYRNGLFESRAQEEAQYVANYISDAIIDVTKIDTTGNPYTFTGSDGSAFTIEYNNTNGTINVKGKELTNFVKVEQDEDGNFVNNFRIVGLSNTNKTDEEKENLKSAPVDNAARIIVTLDYRGRSYRAEKEVYFRNLAENTQNVIYDVEGYDIGEAPVPATDYKDEVEVLRYGEINLTQEYGIVSDIVLNDAAKAWYNEPKQATTGTDHTDSSGYVLTCNDALTASFTSPVPKSKKCELTGKDYSGNVIKLLLYTEEVKLDAGPGIAVVKNETTSNNGYHTPIDVYGIDINGALKKGKKITYLMEAYSNGKRLDKKDNISINANSNFSIGNGNNQITQNMLSGDSRIECGLLADPSSNRIMFADQQGAATAKTFGNGTKGNKLVFTITIDGKKQPPIEFEYFVAGSNNGVTNYQK